MSAWLFLSCKHRREQVIHLNAILESLMVIWDSPALLQFFPWGLLNCFLPPLFLSLISSRSHIITPIVGLCFIAPWLVLKRAFLQPSAELRCSHMLDYSNHNRISKKLSTRQKCFDWHKNSKNISQEEVSFLMSCFFLSENHFCFNKIENCLVWEVKICFFYVGHIGYEKNSRIVFVF